MDLLKLGGLAVDELQPHVADLMESLGNVETIEPEHLAKVRVRSWLVVLNGMKASQELQEEQGRQMLFELDASYNAFLKSLEKEKVFGQEF